jgi:hypothetical protein
MTYRVTAFALGALVCVKPAIAHDFVSRPFVLAEKAVADLQAARDQVLALPTTSTKTKQAALTFVATAFVWDKFNLSVCFWQTEQLDLLRAIKDQAELWTVGTRIRFDFGIGGFRKCTDERSADIRVTVKPLPMEYYAPQDRAQIAWDFSQYGNLPSKIRAKVSMSLVHTPDYFFRGDTPDLNFVVAHEFGHALGLMHEHQRIDCSQYLADKSIVMDVYRFTNEDDYNTFVDNISQIPESDISLRPQSVGSFDVTSIMLYNFPQRIWKTEDNPCARAKDVQHPDSRDIETINYFYGIPTASSVAGISSPSPAASVAAPTGAASVARGGAASPAGRPSARELAQSDQPSARNTRSSLTRSSAKKALEDAENQHLRAAASGSPARGGAGGGNGASVEENQRAAASVRTLLDAMNRVLEPSRQ